MVVANLQQSLKVSMINYLIFGVKVFLVHLVVLKIKKPAINKLEEFIMKYFTQKYILFYELLEKYLFIYNIISIYESIPIKTNDEKKNWWRFFW